MVNDDNFPVTYVLYSHYSEREKADYDNFQKAKTEGKNGEEIDRLIHDLQGFKSLVRHFHGFKELLETPGHEGIVLLFYAAGLEEFLDNLKAKNKEELLKDVPKLEFAARFSKAVFAKAKELRLERRVRMITSLDLYDVLGQVSEEIAQKAHVDVVGPEEGIRYDAPKTPEAVVRMRLLGHGVPVLRVDQDVLLQGSTDSDATLFKAVSCAVKAHHLRLRDSSVSTFLFSASYNTKALIDRSLASDAFEAWGRAFATRIHPALIVDLNEIKRICAISDENAQEKEWQDYVKIHIDEELARSYYGLKKSLVAANWNTGLTEIGAHPFHSVISGALLSLSEGAILDLPPFSNFRYNVMWIDDHLKYSLHREMRHFTSAETLELASDLGTSRIRVYVTKARPPVQNLPGYTLGIYLPSLLWGAIVDAWITPSPILKVRYETLTAKEKNIWQQERNKLTQAPLPHAMRQAMRFGAVTDQLKRELRAKLEIAAVERIEVVRRRWSNLQKDGKRTFASYWATDEVENTFPLSPFQKYKYKWWKGLGMRQFTALDELPSWILTSVHALIEDAIRYIEWTLDWPKYIQIVRSAEQGTFIGDLTWRPMP